MKFYSLIIGLMLLSILIIVLTVVGLMDAFRPMEKLPPPTTTYQTTSLLVIPTP